MILIILTAVLAVSEAATLQKRDINQFHAKRAAGLFSPFGSFGFGSPAVPSGGYTNDALGVVVDAVAPGTRTSGVEPTGLGGPRTSYGSLDSKVGNAAFKAGGTAVKGPAVGITSIFGSGIGQGASVGLPGTGVASGSIDSTGGNSAFGIGNAAVNGGGIGIGSIFGSGTGQANIGLPGIGVVPGSSALDASGIKATGAKVTGVGVTKTTYETIDSTGGNAAFGVGNTAVKGGATGVGSIFGSGTGQANIGLPGFGVVPGSSALDASGIKATDAKVTGVGVTKTTYETIDSTGVNAAFGVGNTAVKGGATGVGSIFGSGTSQANIGLPGFGVVPGPSALDASGIKATNAKVTGVGVSKTTYESIDSTDGNAAFGVGNAVVNGDATGVSPKFGFGAVQEANNGLPGIGVVSGFSSTDASGIKATGSEVAGLGVSKITYESIDSKGEDEAFNIGNTAVKGGSTGVSSVFGSGTGQEANIGLPGIGAVPTLSALDASGIKATGSGVSKTTYESIDSTDGNAAFGVGNAALKGDATGVGSILGSSTGQAANIGLPSTGAVSGSSSLEASGIKTPGGSLTGFGISKTSYESIDSKGGDAALSFGSAALNGGATGVGSTFGSGTGQGSSTGLPGVNVVKGSSSLDGSAITATGGELTDLGVPKTSYGSIHSTSEDTAFGDSNTAVEGVAIGVTSTFGSGAGQVIPEISSSGVVDGYRNDKIHAQNSANNAAFSAQGGASGVASIFGSGTSQKVNAGLPNIGIAPGSSSLEASSINTFGAEFSGPDVSKTTYESIDSKGAVAAIGVNNAAEKSSATSIFNSEKGQEANIGLPSIGVVSGISSSGTVEGYENDKIHAQKFANNAALSAKEGASGNTGLTNIGVVSGYSSVGASGVKTSGAELTSFGVSKNSYGSVGSKFGDAAITIGDAAVKAGAAGVTSLFGSGIGQEANVGLPGIGVVPGDSSSVVTAGNENDKIHAQKFANDFGIKKDSYGFETESGISTIPSVTSLGQKTKEEAVAHVDSGSYNVQTYNEKSDYSSCKGGENTKLSISSDNSILKPNLVGQGLSSLTPGSDAVQGSYGNDQSLSSGGQYLENKFNGFGLNSQTETKNKQELLFGAGKVGVTGGLQTVNSYGVNQESAFQKTQNFGVHTEKLAKPNVGDDQSSFSTIALTSSTGIPNPGLEVTGSSNGNSAYNAAITTGSGIANAFNTGNLNLLGQKTQDSKFGSYFLTSPLYPGYKVVDNKHKLSSHQSVKFSTDSSLSKVATFGQEIPFSTQNSLNLNSNTPTISTQSGQHQGLTSSHYNGITQASISSFPSSFPALSTNFGQLSSNQGSFESNGNQHTFVHKTNTQSQSLQQQQGTVYEYNKPTSYKQTASLTSPERNAWNQPNSNTDQILFGSQGSANQGSQVSSTLQPSQFHNQDSQKAQSIELVSGTDSLTVTSRLPQPLSQKPVSVFPGSSDKEEFSSLQTQFGSTLGSPFGSQTSTVFGQKPTVISQIGSGSEKSQFGSSSGSFNSDKSESSQSSSSSYNGASKGQSVQASQSGVKPFGSLQNTGSSFSQTQFGSTFGTQSGLNSQKGVGTISAVTPQIQPISNYGKKPFGLQSSQNYFEQSQYSSTSGSQFGKKPETTGTISQTFSVFGQKPTVISQTGSGSEKTQFGSSSSSLNSDKSESTQSSSSSYNGASKGQSVQTSQLGVKPFVSSLNTGSTFSQTQSGLNSQKGVGTLSTVSSQVQSISNYDKKPFGSQSSQNYFQQSQYSSTSGSQFGKKPETTGTISQTFSVFGHKPTVISRTGSGSEKTLFGSSSSSLNSDKSESTQSSSSSYNGASKGQSVQTSQLDVKPFVSSLNTGSTFSQTQSGLNSQKGVGTLSTVSSQVQPISNYDKKPFGSQSSQNYFQQSQYSSTSGSQFGKKPETTGTISQTFSVFGQKPTVISQTGSGSEKTQFGSSSSSFNSDKSESTQSSSSSYNGASKGQSVQTSQLGVKPFVSSLNAGSTFSQTQSGLNLQKGVGTLSTVSSQVQPISNYDKKPFGSQSSQNYFQQSQYSSTSGSQFGKKPETTGTISQTFSVFGQKPTVISQTGSGSEKTQFGSSSSSFNSDKSESTQSSSSSYNGASKGESVQTSQLGVKPLGSLLNTGSTFSQTQSGLNSQKGLGTISTVSSQIQPISNYDKKPFGSQSSQNNFQQLQYSSTSGSQFGKKPDTTGTISQTFSVFGQKPTVISQTGSGSEKTQFSSSSSSLNSDKSESTQSSSSSYNGASKGQSVQTSQLGVKPFVSSLNAGSTFSQTQSGLNSQKGVGTISTVTSQVQPISNYDKKPFGSQSSQNYFQQSQYSSTSGSQFGKKPETTGTISQTFSVFGQKPTVISQTGSGSEKTQFGSSSSSLNSDKSESTQSSSSSYNGASKGESVQTSQLGVKPLGSLLNTGSTFSQTQSGLNSQKGLGTISTISSQIQPISNYDKKPFGSQSSQNNFQQLQYSSTSGSQFGKKPDTTGTISQTFSVFGQKPTVISQTGSGSEKTQFGSSSSSLNSDKSESTQSSSSSYNGASKGQSVQTSQLGVKPFVSSLNAGSTFSQTQSGLNSQKGVGTISTVTSQVQPISNYDKKPFGSQSSQNYFQQSQYSSTSGSQFGKKPETTGTISQTFSVFGQKPTVISQTGSGSEKTQFGSSSSSLNSDKSESTQSSSSSYNGASKGQSVQTSQLGVKPFVSSLNTGSTFSQTQSGLNSQKGVGTLSTVSSQVQPISNYDKKPFGSQSNQNYFQQSQYSSTSGSQFGKKPETTGTISQTFSVFGQKPTVISQTGSGSEKTQFGSSSSSFNSDKSESTQSSSSSYNGASKGQSVQTSQLGVKPFVSSLNAGSTFSQTQSGLNSQKGVGTISTVTSQVQPISNYDKKPFGSQSSQNYFQQSQYSSTSGSQFGKKPETTGTISQTFSVFGQKPIVISQTGSGSEKTQFGSSSSSLNSDKSESTQSSSSSYNGASKDQSVQTIQLGGKPFGSLQSTGTSSSQTQFGSTFGTQSGLNSQKGIGTISSVTSKVQPTFQNGKKPSGLQSSQISFQQSQHSSTSGSQFGKKPETSGTISQTFSVLGQKPTVVSQTGSGTEKAQFGSLSSSLNSDKSESTHSSSSSYNGASKDQSVQTIQLGGKPFGSLQSTGSSFTQTQFGSGFGTQSGQNSQKGVGTISSVTTQVEPISQYGKKPFGSQSSQNSFQQSQYSSTTESKFGSKPESNRNLSQISTIVGQKPIGTLQTGTLNENTQFGSSSSSLVSDKSQSTQSNLFSVSRALKDQAKQTAQSGFKPFGFTQSTGSSFSQTQFGTSGSQYSKKTFGLQSTQGSHQDTQLGLLTRSQGLFGRTHSVKPFSNSQITGSGFQQPHLSFSTFSPSSQSQGGYQAKKPFGIIQTPFRSLSGSATGQTYGSSALASARSGSFRSTQTNQASKYQTTQLGTHGLQPFGGSLRQTVQKQTNVFGGTPSIFDQSVSKFTNTVSGAQIPISVAEKSSQSSSFIGKGEIFVGSRDPPRFDIKTGYHY